MTMRLNDMKPAHGARKTRLRVGRGASAGQGKTCGRGVKGQRARKGGYHKVGFEGGQMPIQRRMPKVGFRSKMRAMAEVRLDELAKVEGAVIDLDALKKANIIPTFADHAKVVLSGEIKKAVYAQGHRRHQGCARSHREGWRHGRGSAREAEARETEGQEVKAQGNKARRGRQLTEPGISTRRRGAFRRRTQAPAVPDRRPDRLSHRHVHPRAGHRP